MFKKYLIVSFALVVLSGCVQLEPVISTKNPLVNETNDSIRAKIIKGATTKAQILKYFGKPEYTQIINDSEQFYYVNQKGMISLHIIFNEIGIVDLYSFHNN